MTSAIRKLTAILAADVAGYSRLMGADEEGTLNRLKAHRRELIDPKIAEHRGRIVKTTGDGMLVEFASVVDAVKCAVEIQRAMRERETELPESQLIQFRIGVNTGDVIIDGDDIHGDGVNVAARLEALAEPGTICVSAAAWDQVRGKVSVTADDLGEKKLKNIERPVRVYRISPGPVPSERPALPLPDKPSIAVLPFQNMSGDPEQEYFSDGLVEEIITALSRFHWVFVIARNSSFTYKGGAVDVKQVARELGVRYVLEGSVRKSGQKVRITGQLIDAASGAHIWADRFDGDLADVFELQDRVAVSVVGAIEPKLKAAEIERATRKPTASLDAHDLYLRALSTLRRRTKERVAEALRLFYRAIEIDPQYAPACGQAAVVYVIRHTQGWVEQPDKEPREAVRLALTAIEAGWDDPDALALGGFALVFFAFDPARGIEVLNRSLALNSNSAHAWMYSGAARVYLGDSGKALDHLARASRLSPLDPLADRVLLYMAYAYFFERRFEDSLDCAVRASKAVPNSAPLQRLIAVNGAALGRHKDMEEAVRRTLELDPNYSIAQTGYLIALRQHPLFAAYVDGLRKAGFPE